MIKRLLPGLLLLLALLPSLPATAADGDWKLYPAFDSDHLNIFDAGDKVYVISLGEPWLTEKSNRFATPYPTLFVMDKSSGEAVSYNRRNYLSGTILNTAAYNNRGKYLVLVYTDGDIDLLYDNGRVVNIPGLRNAVLTESKAVNAVNFSPDSPEFVLATDFGFVVISEQKGEITLARNFHRKFTTAAVSSQYIVLSDGTDTYVSGRALSNLNLNDFVKAGAECKGVNMLMPLADGAVAFVKGGTVHLATVTPACALELTATHGLGDNPRRCSATSDGYLLSGDWSIINIGMNGSVEQIPALKSAYMRVPVATRTGSEFWYVAGREGIGRATRTGTSWDTQWTLYPPSRPNASAVFLGDYLSYSDKYGFIASSPSVSNLFSEADDLPNVMCALKDGTWTPYALAYTHPELAAIHPFAKGWTQDPDNPDYFYSGSRGNGLLRLNFADPDDIVLLSDRLDPGASLPGFVAIAEPGRNDGGAALNYTNFSEPLFDAAGNMWTYHDLVYDKSGAKGLWVLPAAARRAGRLSDWVQLDIPDCRSSYGSAFPLRHEANRNLVLINPNIYGGRFQVYDHRGTLDDPSDDRVLTITSLYDQDGGSIARNYIVSFYEDPATGTVWVGTDAGLFTFTPSKAFDNPTRARRVKVARNDGTNLADYLLDGVRVQRIVSDNTGRKWFATLGAGLVQTSADGTHVVRQLTAANSYLPDDNVINIAYGPQSNSLMVATSYGLAEYFAPGASSGAGFDAVKVYPNPVRPDYAGWITIEGLLDNSLVKIVDASGALVRELGSPDSGKVQWDGTNTAGAKVNSGVYFVFMSRNGEGASEANVARILVVK